MKRIFNNFRLFFNVLFFDTLTGIADDRSLFNLYDRVNSLGHKTYRNEDAIEDLQDKVRYLHSAYEAVLERENEKKKKPRKSPSRTRKTSR